MYIHIIKRPAKRTPAPLLSNKAAQASDKLLGPKPGRSKLWSSKMAKKWLSEQSTETINRHKKSPKPLV